VPGTVLCDLLLSEGRLSVDPKDLDFGPLSIAASSLPAMGRPLGVATDGEYKRYKITESGISPRAIPGVPGHVHTVATDEHQEDGILISDEFTDPTKRRAMMEKRMRKMVGIEAAVPRPVLSGRPDAGVTLIGWGSTKGVIEEACEILCEQESLPISSRSVGSCRCMARLFSKFYKARGTPSLWKTTTAASLRVTCAAKPALCQTAIFASTTANLSCRTTLWRP